MRLVFVLTLLAIFAVGSIIQKAESSPPGLPSKLIEEMAAVPKKLESIESRVGLFEDAKLDQDQEIDELRSKVARLEAKLAELTKPKAEVLPVPKPVVKPEPTKASVSNGTYSQPDGYKSQWTYPGDIATHVSTVHGISTAGKTKEQLEREHDAAHNATRSSPVVMSQPIVRYAPQSNCPNGQCPTKPSTKQTWSLFRRR